MPGKNWKKPVEERYKSLTASKAGGAIAVARNPIPLSWLANAGATSVYDLAYQLGQAYLSGNTTMESLQKIGSLIDGNILCSRAVTDYTLHTENALDNGYFTIKAESSTSKMYFFNEYMAFEKDGFRLYTFPDLLLTVEASSGKILSTAEIRDEQEIIVFAAPREKMILGKGLRYRSTYRRIE